MNKLTTMILIAVVLVPVMTAYADHVDNHIWLETAEGKFVMATSTMVDLIDSRTDYNDYYGTDYGYKYCHNCGTYMRYVYTFYGNNEGHIRPWIGIPSYSLSMVKINGYNMFENAAANCGNISDEEEYLRDILSMDGITEWLEINNLDRNVIEVDEPNLGKYHEVLCGYWYMNTVQDEYTYAILPLPNHRELPVGYETMVKLGIQDGLDQWGRINNITFTYTDSKLNANIIVQQQIGDNTSYGNVVRGCLFENNQCTIQLFTDMNDDREQTLVNRQSIEFTIAHEFGHLIGLPHHIDPGHVMNTNHAKNVRTYYEVGGINVPVMYEPTYYERLLLDEPLDITSNTGQDTRPDNSHVDRGSTTTTAPSIENNTQTTADLLIQWSSIKHSPNELTEEDIEIVKQYAIALVTDIIDFTWNMRLPLEMKVDFLELLITTLEETYENLLLGT